MTNPHRGPRIPIAPIRDWVNEQIRAEANRQMLSVAWGAGVPGIVQEVGPVTQIAARLGVHIRCLNRIKRGMYAGARNGVKGEYPTDTISRYYVEDMLTRAGVDFYDIYPELESERDIALEPDGWCKCCREFVTPINSLCPWDDTPVDVARQWAA